MTAIPIEYPTDWDEYELIDTGDGNKLERFGPRQNGYIIVRPEPRILWSPSAPDEWHTADAAYIRASAESGSWKVAQSPPDPWKIRYKNLIFTLRPTEFKHTGVFPEQAVNWNWLTQKINLEPLKILNLFAYTGGSTMSAMAAGAHVTHVDSAKGAISWAKENIKSTGLDTALIRYIEDDVYKFVLREQRRGNTYDGIIMDPPRFGRGPKGEVWKLGEDLPKLLRAAVSILSDKARLLLINAYTADFSAIAIQNLASDMLKSRSGNLTFGELALKESSGNRLVPQGIFVRWSA